jgi:hypothetical protein
MRKAFAIAMVMAVNPLLAQSPKPNVDWSKDVNQTRGWTQAVSITHGRNTASFTVDDARPLAIVVHEVREEYGWLVDYEDPVYDKTQTINTMSSAWQAAHPQYKVGHAPGGGFFTTTFSEDVASGFDTNETRRKVLEKILDDYAKTDNPGRYQLVQSGPSRFDVVGHGTTEKPLLDTVVSLKLDDSTASGALDALMLKLKASTGRTVDYGPIVFPELDRCKITSTFAEQTARTMLVQIFHACKLHVVWQLLYDVDEGTYDLNLDGASIVHRDMNGNKRFSAASVPDDD